MEEQLVPRIYYLGIKEFELPDVYPDIEQCRLILLKVIHHAIKDYKNYRQAATVSEKRIADSAYSFLFNDLHRISWGNLELNLSDITDILDIDIIWLRENIVKNLIIDNCEED